MCVNPSALPPFSSMVIQLSSSTLLFSCSVTSTSILLHIKLAEVYHTPLTYVSNNTFSLGMQPLFRDYFMALFVLCLVVIDLVILVTYTVVEGVRDNLGVKLTTNRELSDETFGVRFFCRVINDCNC